MTNVVVIFSLFFIDQNLVFIYLVERSSKSIKNNSTDKTAVNKTFYLYSISLI